VAIWKVLFERGVKQRRQCLTSNREIFLVGRTGLEPVTDGL